MPDTASCTIAGLTEREHQRIRGRILAVTLPAPEGRQHVDALVSDGTGTLELRWWGRGDIPGALPGSLIDAEGTVMRVGSQLTISNPRYLLRAEDHG